jgi:methylated-DNA-[protein]-cysteine S-methyltransferase
MTIFTILNLPVGPFSVAKNERGEIVEMHFHGRTKDEWQRDDSAFDDVALQFREYFDGKRREFDLPLAPAGTPFQLSVWNVLRTIPYGWTWSYLDVANAIGRPDACRAVGAANGANPLPIVVPCHRVIGTNGSLTGFGGGIDVKRHLLALEGGLPAEGKKRAREGHSQPPEHAE